MHLDLDGDGALHGQLTRALKQAVLERRLAPGARVPATRELASALGLSRNTVLAAYEQLLAEGFLVARRGSGSYVAEIALDARAKPAEKRARARLARFGREALQLRPHRPPGRRGVPLRYPLEYGVPLLTPALHTAWRRALARAADDTPLDYPPGEGLPALRAAIAGYLGRRRGLAVDPEDVVVVSGTQQALDLCARVLLEPGDRAVIEDPHYQGALQSLLAIGAKVTAVPVDADGIDTARLPVDGARLAVVTPSHQFPSGAVLALPRRLALLDWAARHGVWLVEDDYDGEFRYDGRPIAALKSLDRHDRVIYVGTFSKVMFPALRLGYVVAPPALRDALRAAKWLVDRGCPAIEQHALAELMAGGQFERLLRRAGKLLAARRRALLDGLATHCGDRAVVAGTSAGMHVCVWLPKLAANRVPAVLAAAMRRELGVYPITPYYRRPPRKAGLLLGYSGLGPADLGEAARRLGRVLDELEV
jgi:GntR family transcriptional regulator/MocR family aminotransferase